VEAAGGTVRLVYYNKLGFRALLKPEWFEKKGRLLPKAARPPPKQRDKVDSIGRLPAPTKPLPFTPEELEFAAKRDAARVSVTHKMGARWQHLFFFCSTQERKDAPTECASHYL
jgi:large subunit ribosomal protein L15